MASISKTRRNAHPDSPWMWREDWAAGQVKSSHGAVAVVSWLFAVVFSGFSVPLGLKAPEVAAAEGMGVWVLASLFLLASIGLLYWAVQSTLRWNRFRRLSFEISTLPGVVGGQLRGTLHVGQIIQPEEGFTFLLSCVKRVRRARKTEERTIWQDEVRVPTARVERGALGSAVQVVFEIPFEVEPSSADATQLPSIQWRLEVSAELPGPDLHGIFDVPVFKTEESSEEITERLAMEAPDNEVGDPSAGGGIGRADPASISDPSIRVTSLPGSDASVELYFPASRNRGGALALTLFAALWNAFIFWAAGSAPGLFKLALLPFGLIGLLLVVFVPAAWLQSTTLRAQPGRLTILRTMLGRGKPTLVEASRIESFAPSASGSTGGRASYAVHLRVTGRKPKRLVSGLGSKADAEAIAQLLHRGAQP